jgi:hypothetical protein
MVAVQVEIVVGAEQSGDGVALTGAGQRLPLGPADALLTLDHQT